CPKRMPMDVYISGMGIVSALGIGVHENLLGLLEGRQVLQPATFLQTIHRELHVGEIKYSNQQLAGLLGIESRGNSRTTILGMLAMKEAIQQLSPPQLAQKRVAFINATT